MNQMPISIYFWGFSFVSEMCRHLGLLMTASIEVQVV